MWKSFLLVHCYHRKKNETWQFASYPYLFWIINFRTTSGCFLETNVLFILSSRWWPMVLITGCNFILLIRMSQLSFHIGLLHNIVIDWETQCWDIVCVCPQMIFSLFIIYHISFQLLFIQIYLLISYVTNIICQV